MRRTIHAIAAGAAMMCCALSFAGEPATDGGFDDAIDAEPPVPLVAPNPGSDLAPSSEVAPAFTWASDVTLTPPPYTVAAAHFVPPSTSSTAIPLPPAAWTGFASLGGLACVSLIRRLRRLQ
jgi:hypothetical protein